MSLGTGLASAPSAQHEVSLSGLCYGQPQGFILKGFTLKGCPYERNKVLVAVPFRVRTILPRQRRGGYRIERKNQSRRSSMSAGQLDEKSCQPSFGMNPQDKPFGLCPQAKPFRMVDLQNLEIDGERIGYSPGSDQGSSWMLSSTSKIGWGWITSPASSIFKPFGYETIIRNWSQIEED